MRDEAARLPLGICHYILIHAIHQDAATGRLPHLGNRHSGRLQVDLP